MKKYKAIFFDWDGTAVLSRRADASEAIAAMTVVLERGIKLIIISGTTYENICSGKIAELIPEALLSNLFLGLARGNYNYGFDDTGKPRLLMDNTPDKAGMLELHDAAYNLHRLLLERHDLPTDIVFTRPNYCKIDIMTESNRSPDAQYLQTDEVVRVNAILSNHDIQGGLEGLLSLAEGISPDLGLKATTDAKYLELGFTTKSDNVDRFMADFSAELSAKDCSFWGDEFGAIFNNVWGSDQKMITSKTIEGDFFSVSDTILPLPPQVKHLGGGPSRFIKFLHEVSES